jgi:hypothetical protein
MDTADRVGVGGAVNNGSLFLHAEPPGSHVVIEPEIKHEVLILAIVKAAIKRVFMGKVGIATVNRWKGVIADWD